MRILVIALPLLLVACAQTSFQDIGAKLDNVLRPNQSEQAGETSVEAEQSTLQPLKSHYSLTIRTLPEDSTVKIMNIRPKYIDGILLEPGRYDILVQKKGFESFRTHLEMVDRDRNELVKLIPLQASHSQAQAIAGAAEGNTQKRVSKTESADSKQSRKQRYEALVEAQKNDPLYKKGNASYGHSSRSAPAKMSSSITSVDSSNMPEFDGGYIKIADGQYIEMDTKTASKTKLVTGKVSITSLMNKPYTYYVLDRDGMAESSATQFQGFVVKGNFSFDHVSLHRLDEKRVEKGGVSLFENKGRARNGSTLYIPSSEQLALRMKSIGEDSYFFKPRETLSRGDYVAWSVNSFWLFRVE